MSYSQVDAPDEPEPVPMEDNPEPVDAPEEPEPMSV